jgi:hypothetical protein
MPTFAFSATVTGLDLDNVERLDALFTDAFALVPGEIDGVASVSVEIAATSGEDALKTVTGHLARVAPELRVLRVDEDLVNIPEIALRLDLSREAVRLLASGARGDGDFPLHRTIVGQQKLWTWAGIHAWALVHRRLSEDDPHPLDTTCVDWFNGQLVPTPERAAGETTEPTYTLLIFDRPWATTWTRGRRGATVIGEHRTQRPYAARSGRAWQYADGNLQCDERRTSAV